MRIMELLALAMVIGILYLLVRAVASIFSGMSGGRYRAYRHLANRFRGRYESRGMVDPPTVSFPHKGSTIRVGLAPVVPGQTSAPRTRVVARFGHGLPFRLELLPTSRPAPAQPPKGTRRVRTGDADFDADYVVQSNDAEIAAAFLRPSTVREALSGLRRLGPPGGMLLSITPERLLVQVDRNLGNHAPSLEQAVRDALTLHDQLQLGVADRLTAGISIVAAGPSSPADDPSVGPPLCKVCGEPISGSHVLCSTCRTPCHRDCWSFVGSCSIFGCQSKNCTAV